jgi:WD40 repeat protein
LLLSLTDCGSHTPLARLKGPRSFEGHTGEVTAVALSADGRCAASQAADQTLRVWDVLSGKQGRSIKAANGSSHLALSADGKRALIDDWVRTFKGSTSYDHYGFLVYDLDGGQEAGRSALVTDRVDSLALSPDGTQALGGGCTRTYLWDVTSGKLLHTFAGMQWQGNPEVGRPARESGSLGPIAGRPLGPLYDPGPDRTPGAAADRILTRNPTAALFRRLRQP